MPRIVRSPESDEDLFEIAAYIARDNLAAALRLIDKLDVKLRLLSEFPGLGRARDDLAPSLRSFPVGNYIIFYRPLPDGIEVVRVLHGARDLRRIFGH
jgi:toxin ParE1/3/4